MENNGKQKIRGEMWREGEENGIIEENSAQEEVERKTYRYLIPTFFFLLQIYINLFQHPFCRKLLL